MRPATTRRPTGTTGAWVGLLTPPDEPANTFTLVLDLETAAPAPQRPAAFRSAASTAPQFTRPALDGSWQAHRRSFIASGAGFPIGNELLDGGRRRRRVSGSACCARPWPAPGSTGFDGDYDLAIRLEDGQPPQFVLGTPALNIAFPPEVNNPEQLLGDIVVWALKAAAPDNELGQLIVTAAEFIKDEVTGGTPDAVDLADEGGGRRRPGAADRDLARIRARRWISRSRTASWSTSVEFGPIEEESAPDSSSAR